MFAHNRFQAARSPASQLQLQSTNNYARRRIQYFMCKIFADLIFCAKRHPGGVQYLLANNEMSISYLHTPLFNSLKKGKTWLAMQKTPQAPNKLKIFSVCRTQHPHILTYWQKDLTRQTIFFLYAFKFAFRVYLNVTRTCICMFKFLSWFSWLNKNESFAKWDSEKSLEVTLFVLNRGCWGVVHFL